MIPTHLQDDLITEFKNLFTESRYKNVDGDDVSLNIYPQHLPAKSKQDDLSHFPYVVVRLMDGEDDSQQNSARVTIIVGICDDEDTFQGHKIVLNIIQKIYEFLATKKYVEKYEIKYPIPWTLQEEDSYPFYFGGMDTNWIIGKVIQDENLI